MPKGIVRHLQWFRTLRMLCRVLCMWGYQSPLLQSLGDDEVHYSCRQDTPVPFSIIQRCCRNERDGTQSNSFISQAGHYIGQNPKGEPPIPGYSPDLVDKPRLWQHQVSFFLTRCFLRSNRQVWDVPTFRSTQTDPGASRS